jgi:lysophospholipase L1-like esterase
MKNSLLLLTGLLAGLLVLGGCKSNEKTTYTAPVHLQVAGNAAIVCFGDSLTFGHGADTIHDSFPMVLQEKIKIPVINAGVNDDTSADGLARIQRDVLDHHPIMVLIDFGGNDLYNSKPKLKMKDIESNFRQMIELLDNGNCKIYILRYFNQQMRIFDLFFRFDAMLKRLKADYPHIEIVDDIWEGVWGKKEYKYDFTHPNSRGYRLMAENIFNAIQDVLEYNDLLK